MNTTKNIIPILLVPIIVFSASIFFKKPQITRLEKDVICHDAAWIEYQPDYALNQAKPDNEKEFFTFKTGYSKELDTCLMFISGDEGTDNGVAFIEDILNRQDNEHTIGLYFGTDNPKVLEAAKNEAEKVLTTQEVRNKFKELTR